MRKLIGIFALFLLLSSCEFNYYEADGGELTEKQIEFAQKVLDKPAVKEAVWKNTKTLEITFGGGPLVDNDPNEKDLSPLAKLVAEETAKDGFAYTGKDTCVRVLNPDKKELGYACIDYDSF